MRVSILSKWYNEIELAPFFFKHYDFADEIIIYLDKGSNDGSKEFIENTSKGRISWGTSGGKLNDGICVRDLNRIAGECKSDWLICVDADEFVFPQGFADPRHSLEVSDGNVIYAAMWNMYKHADDLPLDPTNPSIMQRRHGDPDRTNPSSINCTKPIIIKPEIQINWGVGCHEYFPNKKAIVSHTSWDGAHWQSVELDLAVKRRIKGVRERISDTNRRNNWAFHNFNVTKEEIETLMEEHKYDPLIF